MAAGDERLLVGRGDDLAGGEGGEDRPEADDPAGRDDDQVDVRPGRQLDEGVRPLARDAARARRQLERVVGCQGDDARPEPGSLLREVGRPSAGREGDDLERVRMAPEDVERLATDRAGRAEEATRRRPRVSDMRRGHTGATTGAANRNESTRSRTPP